MAFDEFGVLTEQSRQVMGAMYVAGGLRIQGCRSLTIESLLSTLSSVVVAIK